MISLAFMYTVNLLSPWGVFKDWANSTETGLWGGFLLLSLVTVLLCLVVVPGLHLLATLAAKKMSGFKDIDTKTLYVKYSYAFVPLGLLAWVAFSCPLIFTNGSYILNVISDPLGKGWDLFGTAHVPWKPLWPGLMPYIQIPVLLAGVYFSLISIYHIGKKIFPKTEMLVKSLIPMGALVVGITLVFLRLFVG